MFRVLYSKQRERGKPAPAGEKIIPVYDQSISDETGEPILVQVGEHNIFDYIQSHAEECDIYKMIDRYNNGNPNALYNSYYAEYGDTTEGLTSLREVEDAFITQTLIYDRLPPEVKKEYTKAEFFSLGSDDLKAIFTKKEEVKNNEQKHNEPI